MFTYFKLVAIVIFSITFETICDPSDMTRKKFIGKCACMAVLINDPNDPSCSCHPMYFDKQHYVELGYPALQKPLY